MLSGPSYYLHRSNTSAALPRVRLFPTAFYSCITMRYAYYRYFVYLEFPFPETNQQRTSSTDCHRSNSGNLHISLLQMEGVI